MSQTIIWTFQDAVEYLLDQEGLDSTASMNVRNAKRCVMEALRRLYNITNAWSIYKARYNLTSNAAYSDGTITYVASTRVVTLSGGTLPSWTARGRLRLDTRSYAIESVSSGTSLTLRRDSCPAEDFSTGESYELYQETYPLPINFKRAEYLRDTIYECRIPIRSAIDPTYANQNVSGEPIYAYVGGDQEFLGSLGITFVPPPIDSRVYEIGYDRSPRELRIANISIPLLSLPLSSTTVTAADSLFPVGCEGSVLRFSASGTAPTGLVDSNPFYAQRIIVSRTSATVVTIDQPLDIALTNTAATLSDPIDLEYGSMMGAFRALAVAEFAKIGNRKDLADKEALAMAACRMAMEAEPRTPVNSGVPGQAYVFYRTDVSE